MLHSLIGQTIKFNVGHNTGTTATKQQYRINGNVCGSTYYTSFYSWKSITLLP